MADVRLTKAEQALLEDLRKSYVDSDTRGYELHVGLLLSNRKTVEGVLSNVDIETAIVQLWIDDSTGGRPSPKFFKTVIKAVVGVYYWHFVKEPRSNDQEKWEEEIQVPGLPDSA